MTKIRLDDEQRLFVIDTGGGYSCKGYDNLYGDALEIAEKLGAPAPCESEIGTIAQYEQFQSLVASIGQRDLGTHFSRGTPPVVRDILERARLNRERLTLTYGDPDTGRPFDNKPSRGQISRSMGPLKVPLLVKTRRSSGGEALLCDCIVRITDSSGHDLYRHPGPVNDVETSFGDEPATPRP